MLDPNPMTRITIPEILEDEWFKKGFKCPVFERIHDTNLDDVDAVFKDSEVGIGAWKTAYDSSGFAPEDYARRRGYFSYIYLVQRKTKKNSESGHLVLDIPGGTPSQPGRYGFDKLTGFQIEKNKLRALEPYCKACDQQHLIYCNASRSLVYRPVMLSLVAIAASKAMFSFVFVWL